MTLSVASMFCGFINMSCVPLSSLVSLPKDELSPLIPLKKKTFTSFFLFISAENIELQITEDSRHWALTAVGGGLGSASSNWVS